MSPMVEVREARGLRARSLSAAVLAVLLVLLACLAASAPAGARTVNNIRIALDASPGAADEAKYGAIIASFADAVFESSNGAITIGRVFVYPRTTVTKYMNFVWKPVGRCSAPVSGYGHPKWIQMFDRPGVGRARYLDQDPRIAGYIMAHEWGHYFFGVFDEYREKGSDSSKWDAYPYMPHGTDVETQHSVMTNQYKAANGGDLSWLNFSTAVDYQVKTAQGRMYDASAWDTLTRPASEDPKSARASRHLLRQYYSELTRVKPELVERPRSDRPDVRARADLQVIWKEPVAATQVVVPNSASMSADGKMAEAKQAAADFVYAAPLGSMVGVVSYDDVATVVQPLTLLGSEADRKAVEAAIDGITPDAAKAAVGDAAQLALDGIAALGEDTPGAVFLLADSASDTGRDPLSVTAAFLQRDVPLYTVALGAGADETVLDSLAKQTSGESYVADAELGDLTAALLSAEECATSSVGLTAPEGRVAAGAVAEYPFEVDASLTSLSAVVTHAGTIGDAAVEAVAPGGSVAATAVAEQVGGAVQYGLSVADPAPGLWHLRVTSSAAGALEISGLVSGGTGGADTSVITVESEDVVRYPQPVTFTAQLWGDRPVSGAHFTATVEAPDGAESELALRDDGRGGDAEAGDGQYTGLLEATVNGVYTLSILGQAKAGTAYYTSVGLGVAPPGDGTDEPLDDVPLTEDVQRYALDQITVTGVTADDHGGDLATATPVVADDTDMPGEIDRAGDHDFFRVAVPAGESALTFRVTGVAFGMKPRLTLRDATGAVLLGPVQLGDGADEYLFATLTGLAEGAVLYAEVAHEDAQGTGTYDFSVGPAIASDEYLPSAIEASADAGGVITPEGEATVEHRASQAYTIAPDPHYHVADVYVDGASVGPLTSYTFNDVTADHTIRATFAVDDYTVTPSVAGGLLGHGTITPATPQTLPWRANVTFRFEADDGYTVRTVTVDGRLVQPTSRSEYTFSALDADHAISVAFARVMTPTPQPLPTYTITSSVVGGHGVVSPAGALPVDYGSSPTFTFAPDPGYRVDAVTADGAPVAMTATNAYTFVGVSASHTLAVSFAPTGGVPLAAFTITPLAAGGHGAVTPAGPQSVALGATPTFSFVADAGYVVAAVKVDGVLVTPTAAGSYTFAAVSASHTLEVSFAFAAAPGALTTQAPGAASVKRGGTAVLRYRVNQAAAAGTADVTITIANAAGRVIKTLKRPRVTLNAAHAARFACRLPRGVYTFTVSATTASGARSVGDASNRLTVR